MTDAVAETRDLTRRFGATVAVDGLDIVIPRGVVYGLLGPNGSGKTTAMRMLTGILTPTSGRVRVLGMNLPRDAEALKTRIGYMTQGFTYYSDLTVLENLQFIAEVHSLSAAEKRRRIEEVLDTYDLQERADTLAGALSGGQRQRLALAATVIHEPELLFLDEPTAAVDPETRRAFWEKLFDLVDGGTTIVVSTHLMDEAERCHLIAILSEGRMRIDGAPGDLMEQLNGRVIEVTGPKLRQIGRDIAARSGVTSVAQIGARLRVLVGENVDAPAELVKTAIPDAPSVTLRPVHPNLEDVFVLATREAGP